MAKQQQQQSPDAKSGDSVSIPYAGGEFIGYATRSPDVELTHDQAVTLQHVFEGCEANGVQLNRVGDAIGHILDLVKAAHV
jgi:hypothetical protein